MHRRGKGTHRGYRLGFEFKYADQPAATRSMRVALDDLQLDHLYVVHPGVYRFALDEAITAIPLSMLIDELQSPPGTAPVARR